MSGSNKLRRGDLADVLARVDAGPLGEGEVRAVILNLGEKLLDLAEWRRRVESPFAARQADLGRGARGGEPAWYDRGDFKPHHAAMCEEFRRWLTGTGRSTYGGDAMELLTDLTTKGYTRMDKRVREEVVWLEDFCRRWDEAGGRDREGNRLGPYRYDLRKREVTGPGFGQPCVVEDLDTENIDFWVGALNEAYWAGKGAR